MTVKNEKGDIIFDRNGIFIPRSRRVDLLLGGIFDEYLIETNLKKRPKIILRPLKVFNQLLCHNYSSIDQNNSKVFFVSARGSQGKKCEKKYQICNKYEKIFHNMHYFRDKLDVFLLN